MDANRTLEFNARNIAEFRSSGGKLGGAFEGAPVLLLTTVGAKSGQPRTSPMMYLPEGDRIFVFASNEGKDNRAARAVRRRSRRRAPRAAPHRRSAGGRRTGRS